MANSTWKSTSEGYEGDRDVGNYRVNRERTIKKGTEDESVEKDSVLLKKYTGYTSGDYLHYSWANVDSGTMSVANSVSKFNEMKKKSLQKQLDGYVNGFGSKNSLAMEEFKSLLLDMTNGGKDTTIDISLSEWMDDSGLATSGSELLGAKNAAAILEGTAVTFQSIGANRSEAKAEQLAAVLEDDLDAFINDITNYLEDLKNFLTENSQAGIIDALVQDANNTPSGNDTKLVKSFLKSSKSSDGLSYEVTDKNGNLVSDKLIASYIAKAEVGLQSLKNISAGTISVPEEGIPYTTSKGKSGTVKNKGELIGRIVTKIGGNLSAAAGALFEITALNGFVAAAQKVSENTNRIISEMKSTGMDASTTNGINWAAKFNIDPQMQELSKSSVKPMSKSDGRVTVTANGSSAEIALNIKKGAVKVPQPSRRIKIHQETNLYAILSDLHSDMGISWYSILNIAAAHTDGDHAVKWKRGSGDRAIITIWRDLVDLAVINWFTKALGSSNDYQYQNSIIIYNSHAYWVKDIIQRALDNNGGGIQSEGGRNRNQFVQDNVWQSFKRGGVESDSPNTRMAEVRNEKRVNLINYDFAKTKVTIYMTYGLLSGVK